MELAMLPAATSRAPKPLPKHTRSRGALAHLGHYADGAAQAPQRCISHVPAVEQDAALRARIAGSLCCGEGGGTAGQRLRTIYQPGGSPTRAALSAEAAAAAAAAAAVKATLSRNPVSCSRDLAQPKNHVHVTVLM